MSEIAPKFEVGQKIIALEYYDDLVKGQTYTVQSVTPGYCGEEYGDLVEIDGGFEYFAKRFKAASKFEVGDKVIIKRKFERTKSGTTWVPEMDSTLGKVGIVFNTYPDFDAVRVRAGDGTWDWWYGLEALELVPEEEVQGAEQVAVATQAKPLVTISYGDIVSVTFNPENPCSRIFADAVLDAIYYEVK